MPRTALLLTLLSRANGAMLRAAPSSCFERYRCVLTHVDASATPWTVDLSTLCREGSTYAYNGSSASGQTFFFNVCGNSSAGCSDYVNTGAE